MRIVTCWAPWASEHGLQLAKALAIDVASERPFRLDAEKLFAVGAHLGKHAYLQEVDVVVRVRPWTAALRRISAAAAEWSGRRRIKRARCCGKNNGRGLLSRKFSHGGAGLPFKVSARIVAGARVVDVGSKQKQNIATISRACPRGIKPAAVCLGRG